MTADPRTALHDAALATAERGWHVFPLVPGEKRPAVRSWNERATTDPDRITRCWTAGAYNIGIATGPSRLVVVDLDTPKTPDDTAPEPWNLPGIVDGTDVLAAALRAARAAVPERHVHRADRARRHPPVLRRPGRRDRCATPPGSSGGRSTPARSVDTSSAPAAR